MSEIPQSDDKKKPEKVDPPSVVPRYDTRGSERLTKKNNNPAEIRTLSGVLAKLEHAQERLKNDLNAELSTTSFNPSNAGLKSILFDVIEAILRSQRVIEKYDKNKPTDLDGQTKLANIRTQSSFLTKDLRKLNRDALEAGCPWFENFLIEIQREVEEKISREERPSIADVLADNGVLGLSLTAVGKVIKGAVVVLFGRKRGEKK